MSGHDVDTRRITWGGAAIAGSVAVVVVAVLLLLRAWNIAPGADRVRLPYDLVIEGPTLQSAPRPDLASYRAEKARILSTSAWVDAPNGIVRIPIESAMKLLVEQQQQQGGAAAAPTPARDAP